MHIPGRAMTLLTLALLLVLGACAGEEATEQATTETGDTGDTGVDEPDEEPADDGGVMSEGNADTDGPEAQELLVVATIAPLADVVDRVLGDRGTVETLIPANVDSHSYEPRPRDVEPLADADVFFGNGLGLNQSAVNLAEANLAENAPLVLLGEESLSYEDLRDDGHSHDDDGHSHGHTHDDGNDHTHEGDDGHVNPHVWTSVALIEQYVPAVADTLSELDPDGARDYADRAEAYTAELAELDAAITEAVESIPEGNRRLIVYHDAWSYFGQDYGIEVVAAVQPSDFSAPSAAEIRGIIDQIRQEDVPALFGSAEFPTDVVEAIGDETGAEYVGDLADDILPGEPGDPEHSYIGMMAVNVTLIVEALGGDASPLESLPG